MKQLSKRWVRRLVTEPETGMGYQDVTFILKNRKRVDAIVHNCEHITEEVEINLDEIENVRVKDKNGHYV